MKYFFFFHFSSYCWTGLWNEKESTSCWFDRVCFAKEMWWAYVRILSKIRGAVIANKKRITFVRMRGNEASDTMGLLPRRTRDAIALWWRICPWIIFSTSTSRALWSWSLREAANWTWTAFAHICKSTSCAWYARVACSRCNFPIITCIAGSLSTRGWVSARATRSTAVCRNTTALWTILPSAICPISRAAHITRAKLAALGLGGSRTNWPQ